MKRKDVGNQSQEQGDTSKKQKHSSLSSSSNTFSHVEPATAATHSERISNNNNAADNFDSTNSSEAASLATQPPNKKQGHAHYRKRYFFNMYSSTEITVYPNDVQSEILSTGREQLFIVINKAKIYLYPFTAEVKKARKILQSQHTTQDKRSYRELEQYFTDISGNGARIRTFTDHVQSETLPGGEEQLFIIENNKKINLYSQSQVNYARRMPKSQNKKPNTSSSNPGLTYEDLEHLLLGNVTDGASQYSNNTNPTRAQGYTTQGSNLVPSASFDRNDNNNNNNNENYSNILKTNFGYPSSPEMTALPIQSPDTRKKKKADLQKYFTNIDGSAVICAHPYDLKKEILPGGGEQLFIVIDNQKIDLYTLDEVKGARRDRRAQNKKQNTRSSTTSNAQPSSAFTAALPVDPTLISEEVSEEANNNNNDGPSNVSSQNRENTMEELGLIFDSNNMDLNQQVNLDDLDSDWLSETLIDMSDQQDQLTASQAHANLMFFGTGQNNRNVDANTNADANFDNLNNSQKKRS